MKTINFLKAGLLYSALIAAPAVMASNTVVLSTDQYSYDVGGEFSAATTQNFTQYYSSSAIVNGGFETFCMESGVSFNPGTTYNYTLGQTTTGTGTGGGLSLTLGAAYLYSEFALGDLAGYDYANSNPSNTRKSDAGELQAAIWYLQGGQTYSGYQLPTVSNNPFYAIAIAEFGNLTGADKASAGAYDVSVLQLASCANGSAAQNQLVLTGIPTNQVATPDGGTTALMLGLGMGGLSVVGLRRKKLAMARA